MRCFNVFVFCIRGIKMMHLGWKEPQYVQFLNGEEHSRVGCFVQNVACGLWKQFLFLCFPLFAFGCFCFSELRWLIVFKAVRYFSVSTMSSCLIHELALRTNKVCLSGLVCAAVFIKLSGLAWIQNCSFLMSSKPWMKSIFLSERRSPDVCTAFQNVFPHEM